MSFVNWLSSIIAKAVVDKVTALLDDYLEKKSRINAVTTEAKELMSELDNANSEAERKAILRKISNFADVSKRIL